MEYGFRRQALNGSTTYYKEGAMIRLVFLFVMVLIGASSPLRAQTYPNRPIHVIVPYSAGGSGDIIGRMIGAKLTKAWGQRIVIEDRGGAGGSIGATLAARSPADGYTLLLGAGAQMAVNPHLYKHLGYDPFKDFVPVVGVAYVEFVLVANPSSIKANTLPELITLLKSSPGKYFYASAGVGSIHELSMEMLKSVAGVNVTEVRYKGGSKFLPDLISGRDQLAYITGGKLKAIALGSAHRLDALPNVPTIAETYPGFEADGDWDIWAPAGTPSDIVAKLNAKINDILRMPDVRTRLISLGLYPIGGSPENLAARMKSDYKKWGTVIRRIGLKPR
jgi:tripartite-type tricarboxylate transporter receptor subunit TctC